MIRTTITAQQLGRREKRLGPELQKAQLRALHAVGKQAVALLHFQSAAIKDLGTYQTSWRYQAAFNRLYVDNISKHARNVEKGRRPGARMPPIAPIRAWAQRRGLPARAAWGIAKNIARRGIKARPVLLRPDIQRGLHSVWERAMFGVVGDAAREAIK